MELGGEKIEARKLLGAAKFIEKERWPDLTEQAFKPRAQTKKDVALYTSLSGRNRYRLLIRYISMYKYN